MRFTPKYPPNVRQAIARLRLDEGRSAPEIATILGAGEVAGCEPTEVSLPAIYDIAAREQLRRQREIDEQLAKAPGGQAFVTYRKVMEMAEQQRRRLEREAAKNGGRINLVDLHKLASTIANLNRGQPRCLRLRPRSRPNPSPSPPRLLRNG